MNRYQPNSTLYWLRSVGPIAVECTALIAIVAATGIFLLNVLSAPLGQPDITIGGGAIAAPSPDAPGTPATRAAAQHPGETLLGSLLEASDAPHR